MTKVLMYIERYWPIMGGSEIAAHRLATALQKQGVEVEVLTRRWKGQGKTDNKDGIKINRISVSNDGKAGTIDFFISSWYKLKFKKDYDILHMHGIGLFTGALAKAAKPRPSIVKTTTEKDVENVVNYPIIGKMMLNKFHNINKIVCLSKACEVEVKKYLPKANTIIIPNGIDTNLWRQNEQRRRKEREQATS